MPARLAMSFIVAPWKPLWEKASTHASTTRRRIAADFAYGPRTAPAATGPPIHPDNDHDRS
ncbi:hypothetical protein ACFQ07_12160 [Actinomadura adrarensis]|uniref:Uncharacterized protein n=1 Tax=Actinomadura adrarensis TaxID=1819600 RepID=A0ABW3CFB2_9ACTN